MRAIRSRRFSYHCRFGAILRHAAQRPRLTQAFLDVLLAAHAVRAASA